MQIRTKLIEPISTSLFSRKASTGNNAGRTLIARCGEFRMAQPHWWFTRSGVGRVAKLESWTAFNLKKLINLIAALRSEQRKTAKIEIGCEFRTLCANPVPPWCVPKSQPAMNSHRLSAIFENARLDPLRKLAQSRQPAFAERKTTLILRTRLTNQNCCSQCGDKNSDPEQKPR